MGASYKCGLRVFCLVERFLLWKMQPDNKFSKKGHNENHSQFQFAFSHMNQTRVISRGAQEGGAPLVKIFYHFGGSAPLIILALALLLIVC